MLFSGFKKYDEGWRILRNDEYIQMAGRAGRRGKDDKGVVIYLPDGDPLEPFEMKMMMKGSKPPITSRMEFHYDFILKTLLSTNQTTNPTNKMIEIMEQMLKINWLLFQNQRQCWQDYCYCCLLEQVLLG